MGVEAILLSAGESSRMGEPKALLDWFDIPLVTAQVRSLIEGGTDRITVVTGAHHEEIHDVVAGIQNVRVVHNQDWIEGKTTSIKVGLEALSEDCETIVVLAVDQPRPAWVVRDALRSHQASGRPITSPRYSGHGGHPLFFDVSLLSELTNVDENREGLREVMKKYDDKINRVCFENPIVRFDLNTPDDYQHALVSYPSLSKPN